MEREREGGWLKRVRCSFRNRVNSYFTSGGEVNPPGLLVNFMPSCRGYIFRPTQILQNFVTKFEHFAREKKFYRCLVD